jgi:flagellin-like hook-associated protein FlgL
MAGIGMILSGIERRLLSSLAAANAEIALSSYRMATGQKINTPADSPAVFVFLSGLQSRLSNITATLANVTAAGSMISQAGSGLSGIQTQLSAIRTELMKYEATPPSPSGRAASQAVIDAAIAQINNLAGTPISGKTILSGEANYYFNGMDRSEVADVNVGQRLGGERTISGEVTTAATQAQLTLSGAVAEEVTMNLSGDLGSIAITLSVGESMDEIAADVNQYSHRTGITASVVAGDLHLTSVDYGSSAKVEVQFSVETFGVTEVSDFGTNAEATINGQTIEADSHNVNGTLFTVNDNGLNFSIQFQPDFTGTFQTISVEDGALSFALSEGLSNRSELGIPSLTADQLGGLSGTLDQLATGGLLALSVTGDTTSQALRVVDEALGKITRVEGLVEGFSDAEIASASALMTDLQEEVSRAIDDVNKVDDVEELQIQAHYQTLADNAVAGLTLLNQQRSMIAKMLQVIAGLD